MLRTSSQEGGLQQRTESPKATSGVPNGFVRPVAVAGIFRPALGGSSGVSAADGKSDVPEKRRSSAAKEKGFGSSLSSEEFSRRRQSFDAKTAISLSQNTLKGDRSSPSRTLPDSESVQEHTDEANENREENSEGTKRYSAIQNVSLKRSKDDNTLNGTATPGKSAEKGNLRTEEKNIKNVSKSSKSDKFSLPGSSSDAAKVASTSKDNVPPIQNGVLDDSEIAAVVRRPRSRNAGTPDSVQKYDTPQTERRRRNKPLLSTCAEKETASVASSASGYTKEETLKKDDGPSSRNEISGNTVSSGTASTKNVAESVQQPGAVYPERRRRDKTSQSTTTEQNRNIKDTQVAEKDLSSQKVHEANCKVVSVDSSSTQTKSELQADAGKPDLRSEKGDTVEASDTQSVSKFRTCRRTSDVIAAKIQTIFSKSDKPLTLPSTNKLSSSKSKSGALLTEQKLETDLAEKNSTCFQTAPEQKVSEGKSFDQKGQNSSVVSSNDLNLPGSVSVSSKPDFTKKQPKCPEKTEVSITPENKSKQVTKTQSETGNSAVKSNIAADKEKFPVKSRVKDNKCSQKLDDTPSLSARVRSSDKGPEKPEVLPRGAGNTAITKKEVAPTRTEPVLNSPLSKEEKPAPSAAKKPLASINFFISEVSVENAPPSTQKISAGKVSPLLITALSVEEKSYATQKLPANKSAGSDSTKLKDLTSQSEAINSVGVTSKFSDKIKTGNKSLVSKEEKESPANQQSKSNIIRKSAVESTSSEIKVSGKGQVGRILSSKEETKVLPVNLSNKESQATQKSSAVHNASSETKTVKITKSEVINPEPVTSKALEKNKVGKTVAWKEGSKVQPISETNLLEKSNQVQKSVVVESSTSETKVVKSVKSDTVISTSSEKDKVSKTVISKGEDKTLTEKNSQVQKLVTEKSVGGDVKTNSSVLVNSLSSAVKAVEKDTLGKTLPLKGESRGTAESTQQKNTQAQKTGADVNISSAAKIRGLKLSEKDKADSTLALQQTNKLESSNLRNKNNEIKKSGTEEIPNTKAQDTGRSEVATSGSPALSKQPEKDKLGRPVTPKENNKVSSDVLKQKTGQLQKYGAEVKTSTENLVACESVNSGAQSLKLSEKDKAEKTVAPKEGNKASPGNLQQKNDPASDKKSSEFLNSLTTASKPAEKDKVGQGGSQPKESKANPEHASKRSDVFLKWAAKETASGAVKTKTGPTTKNTAVVTDMSCKQSGSATDKTSAQKSESEMLPESVKQKSSMVQNASTDKSTRIDSHAENAVPNHVSVNASKVDDIKEQPAEAKTKSVNSAEVLQNQELANKGFAKVKKNLKEEEKSDETSKYADVKKLTPVKKSAANECPQTEGIAKLPPTGKRVEATHSSINSQGSQKLSASNTELRIHRDESKTTVPGQGEKAKPADEILTNSVVTTESVIETKNSVTEVSATEKQPTKDLLVTAKSEIKVQKPPLLPSETSYFRSKTQEIYGESRKFASFLSASEKDLDDLDDISDMDMVSPVGISSVFHPEFPGRSSSYSKLDTPRPPERKRTGFLRETSALTSPPPRVPLRSMSRTGSLKRPDDTRLPMERTLSVLRSASHSVLGPSYTPQRISYTEMLSKLGTCGPNLPSAKSNRKFGSSQVSELWADLSEEQTNSAHTSEMLESETSERMQLEKEVQELQSRYSQMQQKSDKMEMEMMEARVYRATEVNGDLSEDEENDATASIYKQKYERAVRDMEIMKRRLQQQHEEEMEQSLMLKKAADKRLTEALEDVEEERQVVNQWKRKTQKLGAELQDLRLMLEEQMARNGELEKKQRRFDAELSAAQEEIRKEHQLREKLSREKEQSQLEKYSLEQELQATRLDMDMQHEKIALLNRELDELSLSSKGEEEVTQLKRAKQELERKTRDQEEELEELAGQVQMLEQAKLRLEMSLEKLRQEHRRESSVRDEEIEEIRAGSSKKIKNLEAQLENEQEERHQLVKQKHELERRIIELSDQPPPQDPEIERRLRRDLKRTKALFRDAQSMLEHMRDGQANKTLIRQLKNQLEDAEFTKSVAIKARQSAELELQELQSQLEEVTRTKNDIESRCLQLSREKSALQTQLEEMEEEMAEVMKKYKAAVAQMSIDQKSLAEQIQQISELESEKHSLKEQLAEVSTKLDHVSVHTEDSARVHKLDAKVRDLESKIELEQTTRGRLEHQIARLKEQCDRSREECDSLRNKELQAQEGTRRLQRQLRELREDYAALQQKESEAYRKQHELEMALENTEADLQMTKNDLRLACQRIQDLQSALEDDLDSGTDVPDESGSDTDSSLDVSVLSRQCLTPLQRSDSVTSNTSIGSDRQFRTLSHSQDMAFFSRMMQTRTSMDFLI